MAITLVQGWKTATSGGTSISITYTSNVTAANFLVLAVSHHSTITSVTTSRGDTTVSAFSLSNGASNNASCYYVESAVGGSTQVTVNFSTFSGNGMGVSEYSGLATSSTKDQSTTATGGFNVNYNSGNITTTQADELLIGVGVGADNAGAFTPGASWTERVDLAATKDIHVAERIVSATGTYNYTSTANSDQNWAAGIVSFKAAGGGSETVEGSTSEGIELGESFSCIVTKHCDTSEGIKLGDTITKIAELLSSLTEGIKLGDTNTNQAALRDSVSNQILLGDSNSERADFRSSNSEGLKLSDTQTVIADLNSSTTEGVKLGENYSRRSTGIVIINEGLELTDTFTALIPGELVPATYYYITLM
jgi:hypothetical protein